MPKIIFARQISKQPLVLLNIMHFDQMGGNTSRGADPEGCNMSLASRRSKSSDIRPVDFGIRNSIEKGEKKGGVPLDFTATSQLGYATVPQGTSTHLNYINHSNFD